MARITLYITWELVKTFCFTLFGFTFSLMLIVIGKEALQMNLGLLPTLRLIPYLLPNALAFAVPAAILFTVCLVYGRISADNELLATKAMGISPMVLLRPGIVLAFLLSLVAVWLNDIANSWGYAGAQRVVVQSVEEIVYGMLRTQRSYSNDRFSIVVSQVEGHRLIRPIISFQANEGFPGITLVAVEAELESNLQKNTLNLILTDCDYDLEKGGTHGHWPGVTVQEIPLAFASNKEQGQTSPANLPLREIQAESAAQFQRIKQMEHQQTASAAFSLISGRIGDLNEDAWNAKRVQLAVTRTRLHRLRTEPWRRWASGFSCLCFALLGIPLAAWLRNSDYVTTFGICFVPMLFGYYPLFAYGLDQAKSGNLPPYTVWLANLICAGLGLLLIRRVVQR